MPGVGPNVIRFGLRSTVNLANYDAAGRVVLVAKPLHGLECPFDGLEWNKFRRCASHR